MLKPPELENLNGCRDPTNGLRAQRLDFNELFGRGIGFLRNQDAACVSQLLHAVREVHVGAGGIIGLINSMLDRLNNNFAGVNANPDLQIRIAEAGHPVLHRQRCEAATHGVILMGLWGTKQRHDPVAL